MGNSREEFETRLGEIRSSVQQGRSPHGASPVEGMPGYFSMTTHSISILFSVNQQPPRQILIEEIDADELASAIDSAHSLRPGGSTPPAAG
jgi:hypothetical protein